MIRDIFIDLDNTILDFDAGEAVALSTAMRKHGIEPTSEVLERYHVINKALWEQLEEGLVTRDRLRTERFARLFSELSLDADPELVEQDYADITVRRERMKKMKQDSYLNALQVKYAYALTCHKAQGGQWSHVFVDQGYLTEEMLTPDYYRWLYTAFTRASECLFLVNWPDKQTDNPVNME